MAVYKIPVGKKKARAEPKEYIIKNSKGETFKIESDSDLQTLVETNHIDLTAEILAFGGKQWISIEKVPKLATLIRKVRMAMSVDRKARVRDAEEEAKASEKKKHAGLKAAVEHAKFSAAAEDSPVKLSPAAPPPRQIKKEISLVERPITPAAEGAPQSYEDVSTVERGIPEEAGTDEGAAPQLAAPPEPHDAPPKKAARSRKRRPKRKDYSTYPFEKPAFLCVIPAFLSVLPGLGQALNLNPKKAAVFSSVFLANLVLLIMRPAIGVPVTVIIILLSMADAYGSAMGKGFLGGLWRGLSAILRAFCGLTGILLWALLLVFVVDLLGCQFASGTPICLTTNFAGGEPMQRDIGNGVAAIVLSAAVALLFLIQGYGRKFLWARKKPTHFIYVFRALMFAAVLVGALAAITRHMEIEAGQAFLARVFGLPIAILKGVLNLPQTIGAPLGKAWPSFVPGFSYRITTAITATCGSGAASFTQHVRAFRVLLLGGMFGFLPLLLSSVARGARSLPGYGEWFHLWLDEVRERTDMLSDEWSAFRKARMEAWTNSALQRQVRHREAMLALNAEHARLSRIEGITENLARQLNVDVPPPIPQHVTPPPTSALRRRFLPEGFLGDIRDKAAEFAHIAWRFLSRTCGPAALVAASWIKRKSAQGWKVTASKTADARRKIQARISKSKSADEAGETADSASDKDKPDSKDKPDAKEKDDSKDSGQVKPDAQKDESKDESAKPKEKKGDADAEKPKPDEKESKSETPKDAAARKLNAIVGKSKALAGGVSSFVTNKLAPKAAAGARKVGKKSAELSRKAGKKSAELSRKAAAGTGTLKDKLVERVKRKAASGERDTPEKSAASPEEKKPAAEASKPASIPPSKQKPPEKDTPPAPDRVEVVAKEKPKPVKEKPAPIEKAPEPVEEAPKPKQPEPEPVAKAEPEPVQAEPEPVQAEPEPVQAEPEPVQAEPEPVQAEPGPVQAEPDPVQAEPDPVQAEPEPIEEDLEELEELDEAVEPPETSTGGSK